MPFPHSLGAQHAARLQRIADALGRPAEDFFAPVPPGDVAELHDLMRLWSAVVDAPGRRRILNLARQEAARNGYRDGAPPGRGADAADA